MPEKNPQTYNLVPRRLGFWQRGIVGTEKLANTRSCTEMDDIVNGEL